MNKLLCLFGSFIICAVLNLLPGWIFFTSVFLILSIPHIQSACLWQIPMGCLIADIAVLFSNNDTALLFRGLFFCSVIIFSLIKPHKVFLLMAVFILFFTFSLSDNYGVFAMMGAIWNGVFSVFGRNKIFSRKYS